MVCGLLLFTVAHLGAQSDGGSLAGAAILRGVVLDANRAPLPYANVLVLAAADSAVVKVEASAESGAFTVGDLEAGRYLVSIRYVGLPDYHTEAFDLSFGESRDLGTLGMQTAAAELRGATVTARRAIVEVRADRTVFNVDGTINAIGGDALSLLRKAPGVALDNNSDILVMGRSGVLVYIDGKRTPMSGEALKTFLRGLPAEQLDRIEIITNPGAKYEAQGSAGIIDIRLKRNESWGSNGSVSVTNSQGVYNRTNVSATANHREGRWNTFATGGVKTGERFNTEFFVREQNGLLIDDDQNSFTDWRGGNLKLGTDYVINGRHTAGVQVNANVIDVALRNDSRTAFSRLSSRRAVDSILVARAIDSDLNLHLSANLNYRYNDGEGTSVNFDLDRGGFRGEHTSRQPNQFFGPDGTDARSRTTFAFDTPKEINITTVSLDYETPFRAGKLAAGARYTVVGSDNDFRLSTEVNEEARLEVDRSNRFYYDENVAAAYLDYGLDFGPAAPAGQGKAFGLTAGLRAEHTRALGVLEVYSGAAAAVPVDRSYLNLFPSAGLTWAAAEKHQFALSYGRRINRPDYSNLNPFLSFSNLVTFEQGNPSLRPEIANNLELTHTFADRYTTSLGYARTDAQITQLVRPSTSDPRASYLTFDNLGHQDVVSLTVGIPAEVTDWWELYANATASHLSNRAEYADGSTIDLQQFSYNLSAQNTFSLGKGFQGELSGWFSGPTIWAGTFEVRPQGALDIGVQKRFLANKLKVRLAASDVFYTSNWRAESDFAGQRLRGGGNLDARRVSATLSYGFGNQKVKVRQRSTGIEDAAGRVGS